MNTDKHRLKTKIGFTGKAFFQSILLKSVFICAYLWLVLFSVQAQIYVNPVIAGDFPDPSVIRVGDDFYATATTGGWQPEFPILHSKDLVNWQIVGAVFDEKPSWAKGDFWAPEITADKGRYFVYYTARRDEGKNKKGTLCVAVATAANPVGPYTDKGPLVCQEMGSLDPDFARDENGKPFLIWKEDGNDRQQPTWLYAQQLDESGTKLLGKPQKLFRNDPQTWEGGVVEGAYILRRGDYFYLFYSGNACCGRSCNYALGVARSKKLLGTWEKNPANPILKENEAWQCPGHGSIVKTADDRAFLLYHAYRKSSEAFNIGREALLDEVKFTPDGWATINDGRGPSNGQNSPFKASAQIKSTEFFDNFLQPKISAAWSIPINSGEKTSIENQSAVIVPSANDNEAVLAERTISGSYTATTRVIFDKLNPNERAGLAAYSWRENAVGISFDAKQIFVWRRENGKQTTAASTKLPADSNQIYLRMTAKEGKSYNFAFSDDYQNWTNIGESIAGSNIEGARVALIYTGKTDKPNARFDWLWMRESER